MVQLARLLILEKWRRTLAQIGWSGCLSQALVISMAAMTGALAARSALLSDSGIRVGSALNQAWLAWITVGVALGKDLTWRIRLERLMVFPVGGFARLYFIGFVLSFASSPLLLLFVVLQASGWARTPSFAAFLGSLASFILIATSVRAIVSMARTAIFHSGPGRRSAWLLSVSTITMVSAWAAISVIRGWESCLPGYHLGRILNGGAPFLPVLALAGFAIPLLSADFLVQRSLTYSGLAGSRVHSRSIMPNAGLLLIHPSWPSPLWRISLLGWIRNRNALLLMIWGGLYGFFYMYFTKADEIIDYMLFTSMALIFHGHLRGNLLGIDHKGVWLYYLLPIPMDSPLRAKNQTLSLMQVCMVAAVVLPGFPRQGAGVTAAAWLSILSYAAANILIGEICGSFLSLKHPEPIERSSHFSGGMTMGALLVPLSQLFFLAAFAVCTGVSRLYLSPAAIQFELVLIPAFLWFLRSVRLPGWISKNMLDDRRAILSKLAVFSS